MLIYNIAFHHTSPPLKTTVHNWSVCLSYCMPTWVIALCFHREMLAIKINYPQQLASNGLKRVYNSERLRMTLLYYAKHVCVHSLQSVQNSPTSLRTAAACSKSKNGFKWRVGFASTTRRTEIASNTSCDFISDNTPFANEHKQRLHRIRVVVGWTHACRKPLYQVTRSTIYILL